MTRYLREFCAALIAYAGILAFSLVMLKGGVGNDALRLIVTLLPVLPAAGVVWVVIRQLRRSDEMMRQIHLESLAIAFGGTALFALAYGFMENLGYPRLPAFVMFFAVNGFWILGSAIARYRYR